MSAFVVDREHIRYLLVVARKLGDRLSGPLSWYHRGKRYSIEAEHPGDQAAHEMRLAQMLWNENIKSVMYRYPDCTRDDLPGPCGEDFKIRATDLADRPEWLYPLDLAQVFKSCDCYEYQSCEHPGWKHSQAHAFIQALRSAAWHQLPGYKNAKRDYPVRAAAITAARG